MKKSLRSVELKNVSYERNKFKFQKKFKNLTFLMATFTLLFFSFTASARIYQEDSKKLQFLSYPVQNLDEGWVLDTTINKVVFYHKIVLCEDRNVVLLKFENQNDFEITVSWKGNFKTKQIPAFIEGFKGPNTIILKSGSTNPVNCSDVNNSILIITGVDVNPTFIADILDYNFKEISFK